MKTRLPDGIIMRCIEFVGHTLGLHFPIERRQSLEAGMIAAAHDLGYADALDFAQVLISPNCDAKHVETLTDHLTVGETYFYRERRVFEILESQILPGMIRSKAGGQQRINIWSAGCCTGEEAYSAAIMIRRSIADLRGWRITILGTDVNRRFLDKARRAVYGKWSFRTSPAWFQQLYFTETSEHRLEVRQDIRDMVRFSCLNFADDTWRLPFSEENGVDILFCRNVLMYFTPAQSRRVVDKLTHLLAEGGWLIVSPSEASQSLFRRLTTVNFPGAVLYRKAESPSERPADVDGTSISSSYETDLPWTVETGSPASVCEPHGENARPSFPGTEPITATAEAHPPDSGVYEQAHDLYASGRYADACARIIQALPDGDPGRWQMPRRNELIRLLIRSLANQGQLVSALDWCEKAIEADKLDPVFRYLLATVLQELGRLDESAAALKRAIYLEPGFFLAYFGLGNIARIQGRHRESRRNFEVALDLLGRMDPNAIIEESEGLTAGRLAEIIRSMTETGSLQ